MALTVPGSFASLPADVEKVVGTFFRRFKAERGAGKVQVLTRLAPNVFHEGYNVDLVEPLVDKTRANIFGAEATDPLDMVQVAWWDVKSRDFVPTLRKLVGLSEDKIEVSAGTASYLLRTSTSLLAQVYACACVTVGTSFSCVFKS